MSIWVLIDNLVFVNLFKAEILYAFIVDIFEIDLRNEFWHHTLNILDIVFIDSIHTYSIVSVLNR